ncbi:hypothetical protein HMPREF1979_02012 [Actinomyces johnsonii F0542]|uniref:Uncharacterized protein n=1 Tax=Actinomyces johnsonii F0542 TaxID=1321818 RepID=U1QLI4_9ACTO|nr:hypothetical protein HMPREF1979_02012 [Actinomyces johnsonii F0542]
MHQPSRFVQPLVLFLGYRVAAVSDAVEVPWPVTTVKAPRVGE